MEEVKGREREERYMAWTDYVWCNFESISALKTTKPQNHNKYKHVGIIGNR